MRKFFSFLILFLTIGAFSTAAQPFWEKKPYTEWSKEQCRKLLQEAPWAAHSGAIDVQNTAFTRNSTQGESTEKKIDYFAQIRSALPVRQAVIRRAMLDSKYDKMPAEQKKQFDQSAEQYLARTYADVIVITVEYNSNIETIDRELARYWQNITPDASAGIYLTGHNGIRVQPIKYQAEPGAGRAFQLVFPRSVEGRPVVAPGDKSLILELKAPTFDPSNRGQVDAMPRGSATGPTTNSVSGGLKESRAFFEFNLEKLKFKGELAF